MKVKFSIIPFIPAAIVMLVFRIMSIFGADESGNFLGMDKMALSYTVIGIAIGLFVLCVFINIFDRKTAPVYPVKKNFPAGILAILSGIVVIASSVGTLMETTVNSEYYVMTLVCAVFSVPAGIALMLMSRIHFQGKSIVSGTSMLFVFPALWGCAELVYEFLAATKVSISASDLTSLFCYIFLTLYFFSHSMVVSRIKGRNPVKACFIYGLPAIAISVSHSFYVYFIGSQEGMGYTSTLLAAQFIILSLYALSFIIEMTVNSYTKDEIEIVDGLPSEKDSNEEEKKYIETNGYDELVFSNKSASDGRNVKPADDYYEHASGLDDFIIGYQADKHDNEPIPYLTNQEAKKSTEDSVVIPGVNSEKFTEPELQHEAAAATKSSVDLAEELAAARVNTEGNSVVNNREEVAEELSDIDKLLQELDSKK